MLLFRSLWTNGFALDAAINDCRTGAFDGVEGPLPADAEARAEFIRELRDAEVPFIAEICTAGSYVPRPHTSVAAHLACFREQALAAAECAPRFLTGLAGRDAWSLSESVEFFGEAHDFARELDLIASFETHRSRSLFNPWVTRDVLRQLPELRLTCDFSHWCCVCERLVLDEEPELLALFAAHAHHIHARVGYDQGPQVPHPAAPEFLLALEAHERWWSAIWDAQQRAGQRVITMTPEFGPDNYLHTLPFTAAPVADLTEVNHWMALRVRRQFAARCDVTAAA